MDINKPIYLVLITGVIISTLLLGIAFILNITIPYYYKIIYSIELAGVCTLIATPYARILVSAIAFSLNKERKYVLLSLFVLIIMLLSFAIGVIFHISPKA